MSENKDQNERKLDVINEISDRMKSSTRDVADRMRIDLLVGDLVQTVSQVGASTVDEQILEKVKSTQGFFGANTRFHISDETLQTLINEAQTKLKS